MLWLGDGNDEIAYAFLYKSTDGNKVHLRIEGDLLFVNESVRSISLTEDGSRNFADWFSTASVEELQAVEFIEIEGESMSLFESELQILTDVTPTLCSGFLDTGIEIPLKKPYTPLVAGTSLAPRPY